MSDGYGKQSAGFGINREQSIELIVHTCLDNQITDTRQIAYVLATAQHESNDFRSPDEEWGRKQAITNAYHGGEEYYGRGYAHLTHQENYRRLGIELGIADELVEQPSRAAEPDIATRILVLGMRDGTFVPGHALEDHIDARQADYDGARAIINPRDIETAATIAGYARDWEALTPAMVARIQRDGVDVAPQPAEQVPTMVLAHGDANQNVLEMQQYLVALGFEDDRGRAIALDGDFGPGTEQAVRSYQRDSGVEPVNGCVDAVLFAQLRADTLQADPEFRRRTMTDLYGPLNDDLLQRGDRGEPVYEVRLQLEGLGYIRHPRRSWAHDRDYDGTIEAAIREFQEDQHIDGAGHADVDTRLRLNDLAVAQGLAPTTEFDRAENWPPIPPPYTRAEYQLERAPRVQAAPQTVRNPARRGEDAVRDAGPAMDRAAPGAAGQPAGDVRGNPDPSHPGHPRHALYQGCAAGVDALDRQLGRTSDERSACMKASLAELAARNGFDRVDHVLLSICSGDVHPGQNVFVVQGALGDPAHRRAHMRTDAAVGTEVEASFRKIAALDQGRSGQTAEHASQEQARQEQATQARNATARHA